MYRHNYWKCSSKEEYVYFCPYTLVSSKHENKQKAKLHVNFELNLFHCWSCDFSGKATYLLDKYKIVYDKNLFSDNNIKQRETVNEIVRLPKYTLLAQADDVYSTSAKKYVKNRLKCSDKFLDDFELGYLEHKEENVIYQTVIIPSFSKNLSPNFYFLRGFINSRFKKNAVSNKTQIVMFESKIDFNFKPLVLVEGPFDSLRLWTYGIQNVPLLGSSINETFMIFKYIKQYNFIPILFLDNDALEKSAKIYNFMQSFNIPVINYNKTDQCSFSDPAEAPKAVLQDLSQLTKGIYEDSSYSRCTYKERT
jgi:hypothetical protein